MNHWRFCQTYILGPVSVIGTLWMGALMYINAWSLWNGPCITPDSSMFHVLNLFTDHQQQLCAFQRNIGQQQMERLRQFTLSLVGMIFSWALGGGKPPFLETTEMGPAPCTSPGISPVESPART